MSSENHKKFVTVYEKESDNIFRFCLLRISDHEKALDLVQETFLRFWTTLSNGQKIENDRAFLFTIARNLIIDWYRKKKAISLEKMLEEDDRIAEIKDESFGANMELGEEARYALSKIEGLHPSKREVIYLRFVEGLGPKEIARILHETPNAISVKINRAMKELRGILGTSDSDNIK